MSFIDFFLWLKKVLSYLLLSHLILSQVQSLWRTAYKLTRLFASPEYRGPLRAAMTIKGKLEKFRIHMPLINVLCNPGIKDRHWQLMSEQVRTLLRLCSDPIFLLFPILCAQIS